MLSVSLPLRGSSLTNFLQTLLRMKLTLLKKMTRIWRSKAQTVLVVGLILTLSDLMNL